jgi:hypothetical protein
MANQFSGIAHALAMSAAVFCSIGRNAITGGIGAFLGTGFVGHGTPFCGLGDLGDYDATPL